MGKKSFRISANTIPRAPRMDFRFECSCSNSCERVLELLFADDDPITLEEMPLSFNYTLNYRSISDNTKHHYEVIRKICNTVITNRNLSLEKRLIILGKIFQNIESLNDKDITISINDLNFSNHDFTFITDINLSYEIQKKLVLYYANHSISIQKYAEEALKYFGKVNEIDQYKKAKERLQQLFPNIEIMLEKIIHNYLIYIQFPYSHNSYSLLEEYASLCGVYLFVNYIVLGYMANRNTLEDFIDVVSAIFRLINHSNFNQDIFVLLKPANLITYENLKKVI